MTEPLFSVETRGTPPHSVNFKIDHQTFTISCVSDDLREQSTMVDFMKEMLTIALNRLCEKAARGATSDDA